MHHRFARCLHGVPNDEGKGGFDAVPCKIDGILERIEPLMKELMRCGMLTLVIQSFRRKVTDS